MSPVCLLLRFLEFLNGFMNQHKLYSPFPTSIRYAFKERSEKLTICRSEFRLASAYYKMIHLYLQLIQNYLVFGIIIITLWRNLIH